MAIGKSTNSGPNMTPMVDVVMCILIFFMLGSVFLSPEVVLASATPKGMSGPGGEQNAAVPPVRFILTLVRRNDSTWLSGSDGAIFIIDRSDNSTGSDSVARYLAGKRENLSDTVQLVIAPQPNVPYQDVITVYDECCHAKFNHVAFAPARPTRPARVSNDGVKP